MPATEYAAGRSVRFQSGMLLWRDDRRGCEWGTDQPLADFIAKGPPAGVDEMLRDTALDLLKLARVETTEWFDPRKTVQIRIQGTPILFYDDFCLKTHDESVRAIVDRYSQLVDDYYAQHPLRSGWLAADAALQGLLFARDTELSLYPTGMVMVGILARDADIGGATRRAGARVVLGRDGSLEM